MNGFFAVFKKELRRFFTDARMVFTVLLMPGLLIYLIYTFMGSAMTDMFAVEEDYVYRVGLSGSSELLETAAAGYPLEFLDMSDSEEPMLLLEEGMLDLYVDLPANLDASLADAANHFGRPPHIAIYYNSTDSASTGAYSLVTGILEQIQNQLTQPVFYLNAEEGVTYDVAAAEDTSAMFFSLMMPMLLTMMLFTGAMSVSTESIAGEKDRGTIATLLITPVKRSHIAWGKILALSCIAICSGVVTTGFIIASLPKLMGGAMSIETGMYTFGDYILLALVVISTVVLYVTMISLLSAFAKSVKEAQTMITPLILLVTLIGVTSMLSQSAPTDWYFYLIPLYNSVQAMTGIFAVSADTVCVLVTAAVNLLLSGVGVIGLARMFASEKIMFSK